MLKALDKDQRKIFCAALGNAFGDYDDLNLMTRFELDTKLSGITRAGPMDEIVLDLVEWAQMNGRLDDLIQGALAQRPGNPWLRELAPVLVLTATGDPTPQLQGIVLKNNALQDVGVWRAQMAAVEDSVCRFEVTNSANGQVVGVGSGFLIADDVVLTNRHVIEDLKQPNATQPLVRFSARTDASGVEQPGDPYPLEGDDAGWLKGFSPVDALDYALVKLPKGTGRAPVPTPAPYSFQQGDIYFILQHPMGAPLKFGGGTFVSLEGNSRVNYTTNSEPGSSGAPVFTQGWQPVALHRSGSLAYNSGVPLTTIVADATAAGTWP